MLVSAAVSELADLLVSRFAKVFYSITPARVFQARSPSSWQGCLTLAIRFRYLRLGAFAEENHNVMS